MIDLAIKLLAIAGACAWLSAFLPSTHSNTTIQLILDAMNFAGGNIHRAKNKADPRV